MIQLLIDSPLLLLFVVAAIGYPLGQVKIRGSSLGVAAVLFVGLAAGSLHPDLKLPEVIYTLGLVLFVYTVGLSSGPGFFASFQRKGLRDNLLAAGMILLAAVVSAAAHYVLHLKSTQTAGMFAGSLTNTPALAGVLEYIKTFSPPALLDQGLAEPVVGYSITYPMGVVGTIVTLALMQNLWKVNYAAEAQGLTEYNVHKRLSSRSVRITQPRAAQTTVSELIHQNKWGVVFGRVKRDDHTALVTGDTRLQLGDTVTLVSTPEGLDRITAFLGEPGEQHLELDRSEMDFRRIFVSNPKLAGSRIKDLHLQQRFGAVITRVRRGDMELLPRGDTVLELGDRVRVLTQRERMDEVSSFFGDSYRALSEIDILTFSLGLAMGLVLGSLPVPLPGGIIFKLGFAGGPLIVALILSTVGHTGPMTWALPYSANLTLRQIGLVLFLAGVGTRSGYAFVTTLTQGNGGLIFVAGMVITCVTALATLWIGYKLFKIPLGLLAGMLAGIQTQPAVLGFALEQADNDLPNIGYATVYPVAMIAKILAAQLLLTLLRQS
jgi:putative transport protein